MAEHAGEKSEQPTPKKLEEAVKKGQIARSPEVQTVFVLLAALMALKFTGYDIWRNLVSAHSIIFSHLHDIPLSMENLQAYAIKGVSFLGACVGPILVASVVGGLLAGGLQNRFQTSP
jgi:flagellar biosynthesis protein FlhB